MCIPAVIAAIGTAAGGTAATAAGAAAGAATAGAGLSTIGTLLSIGGSLYQGIQGSRAARENQRMIAQQQATEAQLTAVKDQRERLNFASAIAKQSAELAGRGVSLDSPTAVFLGQTAAKEMAFNSQSIRSTGQARHSELSAEGRMWGARQKSALISGGLSAAGAWLNRKPEKWAGLQG